MSTESVVASMAEHYSSKLEAIQNHLLADRTIEAAKGINDLIEEARQIIALSTTRNHQLKAVEDQHGSTLERAMAVNNGVDQLSLLYGGSYNFKNQPERLKYTGKFKGWHQFEKIGEMGVWCELPDEDLHMIEKTKDHDDHHCEAWKTAFKEELASLTKYDEKELQRCFIAELETWLEDDDWLNMLPGDAAVESVSRWPD